MGMRASAYEDRLATALLGSIRKGDVVWDIGQEASFFASHHSHELNPPWHRNVIANFGSGLLRVSP
jgi:hypothetical protein